MKRILPITVLSTAAISLGGINLFSCATTTDSTPNVELTPVTRHKKEMNPNVPNIKIKKFRLQILDDSTVRFEYMYDNPIFGNEDWLDDDTLFVPNRTSYEGVDEYNVEDDGTYTTVTFSDIKIVIPNIVGEEGGEHLDGIKVYRNGEEIYDTTLVGDDNNGNLPSPEDTPDVFPLIDSPRIIEPPFGYSEANLYVEPYRSHLAYFKKTCGFEIQPHRDVYLMFPRGNARALRQQYRNLAGPSELVRLSTLGAWDSRYYPYNETTAQEEVDHYNENNLPLDNLVIDTDWRAGFDGKGYFVNETLFPNMPRFLKSIHDQNIEVCFNDHPEPQKDGGMELNVLDPTEVTFRRTNLQKIMEMGLDTWWYDRNWSTSLICPTGTSEADLNHETWGDYLYNNVTRQEYMLQASEQYEQYGEYVYKRPIAMSNVVQIRNGTWKDDEGFTDSAAHRYSIQWTGDQNSKMLDTEVANVIKTGINSMPYMSSDLAGHTNPIASDYYYQRWMEYGALSPIFRIHCTRDLPRHCQPWLWSDQALNTFRNWINLRYRLLPLYYSLARESYETGMPICRALGFDYPDVPDNYKLNEYLLGNNILFAPCLQNDIVASDTFAGSWSNLTTTFFENEDFTGGQVDASADYSSIDEDHMEQAGQKYLSKSEHFAVRFTGTFTPSETKKLLFNSDDGVRVMVYDPDQAKYIPASDWSAHGPQDFLTGIELQAGKSYPMIVDYYQDTGNGSLHMKGYVEQQMTEEKDKMVYLPKGLWYDVFHGKTYEGPIEVPITYQTAENAVFARLGSMTPLINNARNTKELDWTKLAYDVYPTVDPNTHDAATLYEDDFETVAYQLGYYHKSHYNCYYDESTHEFVIRLAPSEGWYIGDDAIANRTYTIRLHDILENHPIGTVTLDGKPATRIFIPQDKEVTMPFGFAGSKSATEDVYEIVIDGSVRSGHEIRVKLA